MSVWLFAELGIPQHWALQVGPAPPSGACLSWLGPAHRPYWQLMHIWNPDFQYMPGIYHVYPRHMPMSPICLVYTWYIHVYTMYIQCRGYTWYIRGISMYIHGISFDVYTWYIRCISVDIPSFLFLDFSAGPCCWSHSMGTHVLVIKIGLFHPPPWQSCLGIRRPTKGSLLLSPSSGRRWRLALRGAAGRLRGGRLGDLVLVTMP